MDDKFDKSFKDSDEFNFDSDEHQSQDYSVFGESNRANKKNVVFGRLNYRLILGGIGALLLLLASFKFINLIFFTKSKHVQDVSSIANKIEDVSPPKPKETANAALVPSPVQQPVVVTSPLVSAPANSPTVNSGPDLTEQNHNLQNQVSGLASNLSTLQSNLTLLSNQLAAQNTKMDALETKLDQLSQQKSTEKHANRKFTKKHKKAKVGTTRPVYYIQSVIPGRAWLVDGLGKNITVSTGDRLQGYGKVTQVDAITGQVFTSSGAIIKYRA